MQHRYFGDVGDFGKYGLLRALCGLNETPRLRLGVIWYLFPNEDHNNDGKHVSYLMKDGYRNCDQSLYDSLRKKLLDDAGAMKLDGRHLDSLLGSEILPADTVYFARPLEFLPTENYGLRLIKRSAWVAASQTQTQEADIVFLDPDNGIECASVSRTKKNGPKYVFWDDVDALVHRYQSVVIYHHLSMQKGTHLEQVEKMLNKVRARYPQTEPMAIIFRRGNNRAYFIIPREADRDLLRDRVTKLARGQWSSHFTLPGDSRPQTDSPATGPTRIS